MSLILADQQLKRHEARSARNAYTAEPRGPPQEAHLTHEALAVILRSSSGTTGRTSLGPTKIVCEDVPAHPDRPMAARKGTLPGKLQDVVARRGGARRKLGLARWSRFDLVGW